MHLQICVDQELTEDAISICTSLGSPVSMIIGEIYLTVQLLNVPCSKSCRLSFVLLLFPVLSADPQSSVWIRTLKTLLSQQSGGSHLGCCPVIPFRIPLFHSILFCYYSCEAVNRLPESVPPSIRAIV